MAVPTPNPTKTLVLLPGECVIFPADVVIQAVVPTGAITVSSTCDDILPAPSGYKCWQFLWEYDDEGNFADAYFTHITIDGTEYPLLASGETNSWDNGGNFLASSIPISVPTGIANVLCNAGGTAVNPKIVAIEVPAYLGIPKIGYQNPAYDKGELIPYEDVCTC